MIDPGFADHPDAPRGTFVVNVWQAGKKLLLVIEAKGVKVRYKVEHNELDWVWRDAHVPCIKGRAMP